MPEIKSPQPKCIKCNIELTNILSFKHKMRCPVCNTDFWKGQYKNYGYVVKKGDKNGTIG